MPKSIYERRASLIGNKKAQGTEHSDWNDRRLMKARLACMPKAKPEPEPVKPKKKRKK